jgi:drug/metabolite transporter (DMT)-like permease
MVQATVSGRDVRVSIALMMVVILANAILFSIIPYLTQPEYGHGLHAFQIMLCYCGIAAIMMLPWALRQGRSGMKTRQWKLYGTRALLEYGAFTLSFYSLGYLGDNFTLPMHTALNFITPLIATIGAILILKEKSHMHTWIALLLGFIGVLVVTRPGMMPASPGVLYVLGAALGFSLTGIVIKLLTRTESPLHVAFYMLSLTAVLALPAGITHWKAPTAEGWMWLIIIGCIGYLQQTLVAKSIAKVPYTLLIPLNFSQLIFATMLGFFVYHKLIDGYTMAGSLIIIAATIYNQRKSAKVREISTPA